MGETKGETRSLTCIACPTGCQVEARLGQTGAVDVHGNKCAKGKEFAVLEMENPVRHLTTTIAAGGGEGGRRLPVRSDRMLPKDLLRDCVKALRGMRVDLPVRIGQPVLSDILGTGVNIVASRDLP